MAAHIAAGPPSALRGMKANLNDAAAGIGLEAALAGEADRLVRLDKAQSREAVAAFLEKRPPVWED
eukprot:SAG11_NODE_1357_length_5120_cov_2.888668_5_plen_66_part_00